jgi:polar amino acid transport system substrate-binding protein
MQYKYQEVDMKSTQFPRWIILALVLLVPVPMVIAGGQVEDENTISFAGSGGYPPFNFITEDGDVDGFDVDVAREIARRLDMELDYVTTAWDGIIEGLRAGRYDGILGSMGITPEREEIVDFSEPYYYSGPQLIVHEDSDITSVDDIDGSTTIALVTGTTFEEDANTLEAEVKLYEDDNQTLMELLNGRVDAVLTDRIVGLNAIGELQDGDTLTLVDSVLRTETMGIAFQDGNDDLRLAVNDVLQEMRDDGTLRDISEKWFNGEDITVQ